MALQNYLHARAREAARIQPMIDAGASYRATWSAGVVGKSHADPLRGPDGTLYVGCDPGFLYAFGPSSGLRWRFKAPGAIHSAPALGPDGTIYVGDASGTLSALSPNGALIWQRDLGTATHGAPLLHDGALYLSVDSGLLRLNLAGA
jgi:outer membrane protein assembly factor BamB